MSGAKCATLAHLNVSVYNHTIWPPARAGRRDFCSLSVALPLLPLGQPSALASLSGGAEAAFLSRKCVCDFRRGASGCMRAQLCINNNNNNNYSPKANWASAGETGSPNRFSAR